jgi:hypothetical protein
MWNLSPHKRRRIDQTQSMEEYSAHFELLSQDASAFEQEFALFPSV